MVWVYYEKVLGKQQRWYRISRQESLFGPILIREWGRIGRRGRQRIDMFDTEADQLTAMAKHQQVRQRHGYTLMAWE
jgi:predicted DNA-binding WGR domain protein